MLHSSQADLTGCDREPIHRPGAIQPHGVLIALDPKTLEVVQVAGPAATYFGFSGQALIGQRLETQIGSAARIRLEAQFAHDPAMPRTSLALEVEILGSRMDATAHLHDGLVILELEPQRPLPAADVLDLVHSMIGQMRPAERLETLLQSLADQVQHVTGYDRVMVYRFQADDSGHVVAEARSAEAVPSYLDLHYPASDIPAQARELYARSWIRYIPDAAYTPEPLVPPLNPRTGEPLDLSWSRLRAVSPVHLEYLGNMGVRSSMSLSLMVGSRLWGLIACHAAAPLYLSARLRLALEVFAQLASLHLGSTIDLGEANERIRFRDVHDQLTRAMSQQGLAEALIGSRPNLLDYIQAAGVVVRVEGENFALGQAPDDGQLDAPVEWLNRTRSEGVFFTDHLAADYPAAEGFLDRGAGLLALSVSRQPRDYVLWFLPEVISTVTWAGDPSKPVTSGPLGDRLTPRKSFAAWTETVAGRSRPWRAVEIDAAILLRTTVLEVVLHRIDQALREKAKANIQQNLLMNELDHRVKNTIATIQSLVRLSSKSADELVDFTRSIEKRLQAMAKAHTLLSASRWQSASMRTIVEEEFAALRSRLDVGVIIEGDEYALEPRAALSFALALHELITNAVKHGSLSNAAGKVLVTWNEVSRDDRTWLAFHWTEVGGPPVMPTERRGFGRTLLERVFAEDVSGRVDLAMNPEGVRCLIEFPFERLVPVAPVAEKTHYGRAAPVERERPGTLVGVRMLVVEDDGLIAADLAEILRSAGATVIGPYGRLGEGLAAAADEDFDIVLLDVNLRGRPSWPIANLVIDRGIPVVLATGYSEAFERPAALAGLITVNKPYDSALLLSEMQRALVSS
ncbi:HWE histidine kinase domain-containing protein [Rhodoplanes sp. TEM]|uniref:histidine kinase n=1 Tax=Rhodoplanes tepidamans TaxID=200616 RepID=A0ABT5JCZ1_RHOTP|nr:MULTISPECIES: HWE histidine kinase domain-containing protein [Rhodoplanes]MDC7787323.1 HWE histidine kinase domain-containing protein [Rhodoplanes tepidamans]MDC7984795.1 HWE histidine kinase domain-containing protein [Rhodoplanes sp. TEM]MDQ0358234.1 light-regulated signal transduction histidine kinase (bacteriophytochrome) [Rhodoplanes tepidamans]